jgi:hypothetical protein
MRVDSGATPVAGVITAPHSSRSFTSHGPSLLPATPVPAPRHAVTPLVVLDLRGNGLMGDYVAEKVELLVRKNRTLRDLMLQVRRSLW